MAINTRGQVTTTGLMNQGGTNVQVPDMRNLTPPEKPKQVPQSVQRTDEDKVVSKTAVSPSVDKDNIVLPRSVVINYAMRIYGGDENEAMNSFISDLSNIQMDINNVPLDRETNQMSSEMMAQNDSQLPEQDDSGVDISQDLV
jgi:hypothetical protein